MDVKKIHTHLVYDEHIQKKQLSNNLVKKKNKLI